MYRALLVSVRVKLKFLQMLCRLIFYLSHWIFISRTSWTTDPFQKERSSVYSTNAISRLKALIIFAPNYREWTRELNCSFHTINGSDWFQAAIYQPCWLIGVYWMEINTRLQLLVNQCTLIISLEIFHEIFNTLSISAKNFPSLRYQFLSYDMLSSYCLDYVRARTDFAHTIQLFWISIKHTCI